MDAVRDVGRVAAQQGDDRQGAEEEGRGGTEVDEADEAEEERAEKPRPRKKRSPSSSDRPRRRPARS
ncbi:hypothetical protein [Streptomyces sp. McG6]|uniref:hypothetical protein n=1 Tax=Streptomyces sp. McG6 TaxID=2725485 RepID=UPI002554CA4F